MKRIFALMLAFLFPLSVFAQAGNSDVNIGANNPLSISGFTNGDIIYFNSGVFNRLAIGSGNQVLGINSGIPAWVAPGGGTGLTSVGLQWDNVLYPSAFPNSPLAANGTLGPPILKSQSAATIFGNFTGLAAAPSFNAPGSADQILGVVHTGSGLEYKSIASGTGITVTPTANTITVNLTTPVTLANGGTAASLTASNGGIFYSTGASGAILAGTATANQVLLSGSSSAPAWSTANYPATTTINQLLYSSSANTITGLATANNGTLITSAAGIPSISATLPAAVQGNITSTGTIASGTWQGTAIGTPYGGTGTGASQNALTIFGGPNTAGASSAAPAFTSYDSGLIFGGAGIRQLPTTGTITGEYWHLGNWTQTGAITSNRARIHISGTMTINNTWTVATEISGASANQGYNGGVFTSGNNGGGLGPGQNNCGFNSTLGYGGGGGGHGGAGGGGGSTTITSFAPTNGGSSYPLESLLSGSSGASGSTFDENAGGAGGNGGGSLYVECTGNINCTAACAMTANGGAGAIGGTNSCSGGGGSGGAIQMRSFGTITLTAGGSMTATGGAGGSAPSGGAGGGGGGGGIIDLSGTSITAGFTPTASGGSGTNNGSTGIVNLNSYLQNVRTSN
jgi:hypothetical protein